ncbi:MULTISPECIES: ATP-binding protein [Thermomonospora]|uniref:Putative anti-sigma regulatory factor, serine/threonine protein kinase n=1 Tax=Thermomonospora curvata (strain ATCC 19995 / DSM 43183 / JCM 3096 / KCTC 9072 / NBRC 15933 / NCIMB 10081 / Henssen B9) TaxID=471852 RepID=D1AEF5_THECD|nr:MULTISPECIES: ATP-binding protein [Thermomonospora]ACY95771.1 putative anti-sigma regulatory factor, serine/threonine protein kinase [Thermomonospora curvata DSM 43183]
MSVLPVERHVPMPPAHFRTNQHDPDLRREKLRLAALPNAVGTARRFVTAQLRGWGLDQLAGDCELVVSELVTNAVIATGDRTVPAGYARLHDRTPPTIVVQLRLTWYRLLCEVWDASPRPPVPAAASPLSEGGRGLHLVAAYAAGWSAYTSPAGGKVVYAWWNLPAAGPEGTAR